MSDNKKIRTGRAKKTSLVQAPIIEAPIIEAPIIQVPIIQVPVIQVPSVEAPVIEAPVIQAPSVEEPAPAESSSKLPKKRGRKPKGGKIIQTNFSPDTNKSHEPNIIMHLKCGENDLNQNTFNASTTYEPAVETFQFENNKSNDLCYSVIDYGVKECGGKDYITKKDYNEIQPEQKENRTNENDEMRQLWGKLKELT